MSTSLQLSNSDNFGVDESKVISTDVDGVGFKVDLLAGRSSEKEMNCGSDSESSSEEDEEEEEEDTSEDEREIANNPVLKERLRHLDKYASSFRYNAGLSCTEPATAVTATENLVTDCISTPMSENCLPISRQGDANTMHSPSAPSVSCNGPSIKVPSSPAKNPAFSSSYSILSIGGSIDSAYNGKSKSHLFNAPPPFAESEFENPSLNSNCENSAAGDADDYDTLLSGTGLINAFGEKLFIFLFFTICFYSEIIGREFCDSEKKYHCHWPDCQRRFRNKDTLTLHYHKHTGENPFRCDLCSFTCHEKTFLVEHYHQQHSKDARGGGQSRSGSVLSPGSSPYDPAHRPLPLPPIL
ncbi:unnamed protein product, partial [Dibothriocephalus latus]